MSALNRSSAGTSGLSTATGSLSTAAEVMDRRKRSPSFKGLTVSGKVDHHPAAQQENELKGYSHNQKIKMGFLSIHL
ncbi:hypothetical protein OYT88_19015 [Sporolactobacillus sp. CQH2019]|uniref:hypothetical protein n=1 Tax=Sporolactobacillus sp. CQH2019 TaxID=3023512 RepID=UPI0023679787|nr:hypothetical protein [Sporolactobacillus sp. CQH2019]MDD9150620.1 hypothetical protein [Sporolactobacillus sp. CQH2019]